MNKAIQIKKRRGIIQTLIGIDLGLLGIRMMFESDSLILTHPRASGMLFAEGAVLVLWGVREGIGSLIKDLKDKKVKK